MVASEIKSSLVGKSVVFNNGMEGKVSSLLVSDGCVGIKVEREDEDGKVHTYVFADKTKDIFGLNDKWQESDNTLCKVSLK